ncbi:hypothetical protein [Alteribacter populi]|uniref:hypothetical protein n=1 Tax=Alteribacter populi TaxID=2011011 RepID=UPI000BBAD8C7|nr:hypothetical protein [Alteribacter populi]
MKQKFQVLEKDQYLAEKLHDYIVEQRSVIAHLELAAHNAVINLNYDFMREMDERILKEHNELQKALRDMGDLHTKRNEVERCVRSLMKKARELNLATGKTVVVTMGDSQ